MENNQCIFCTQSHDNNYVNIETQQGNACNTCYDLYIADKDLCMQCSMELSYKNMSHRIETETQKGNVCNACYDTRSQEKECNVCHHILPVEDFVTEWGGGYDLPEEMCSECAQEYAYELNSKYEGW